jgi:tripartite-type tricarboxylate transporter receptor subunit TctC
VRFVAGAVLALAATQVAAQAWPAKPIRMIVPFTPGGSTDILARAAGNAISEGLGQQVVVENRPGAGGSIGMDAAARAAPDGYTIVMGHIGTLAVNPWIYPKLPYDPVKDFAPISLFANVPNVLVVHPTLPVKNVQELIAMAKAKPGALTYGSGGTGSAAHLAVEYFKLETKTDILHVPYKGTGPMMTDLLGGQLQLTMTGLVPTLPHVKSGKMKLIAVASAKRIPMLPDTPTIAESGVPGFEATQWYGLLAPAGTPPAIVDRLAGEIRKALGNAEVKRRLEAEGADPVGNTPAQFAQVIKSELARWQTVIRQAGIKAE